MVFVSELQRKTLILLDELINKNIKHDEIEKILFKNDYEFIKEIKNGYMSKTKTQLYKNHENTLVTLIKRRNGLADFETIILN